MTPSVSTLSPSMVPHSLTVSPEELEAIARAEARFNATCRYRVPSAFHEKQTRLLTHTLLTNWSGLFGNRSFLTMADVGLCYCLDRPAIATDFLLRLDEELPPSDDTALETKAYFTWRYGRPDVVFAIISEERTAELAEKLRLYARIGVTYCVVFDRNLCIGSNRLSVLGLTSDGYEPLHSNTFPSLRLGVMLWEGVYEGTNTSWLRWCDFDQTLLATDEEVAPDAIVKMGQAE